MFIVFGLVHIVKARPHNLWFVRKLPDQIQVNVHGSIIE